MKIGMSMIKEFEDLYERFANNQLGRDLLSSEGIAPDQLDVGAASHEFFSQKLADISTDSNSSAAENVSPVSYRSHINGGLVKLLGFHTLWYHTMKRYGKEFADKAISMIWTGDLYFHDAHGVKIQMPYCFAFSLDKLVLEGRPYGSSPNTPPKYRRSFINQTVRLISDMSKQFAGATAPSDLFLWYSWYANKEGINPNTPEGVREIEQDMQSLICEFNDQARIEGDPPFTNIGIYDPTGLENLFGHIIYPDMTTPDFDYIMKVQKIFCEWFSHGDKSTGFPYKFPVVTINITTDEKHDFVSDEFVQWVSEVCRPLGNFNIHMGDKSKLAMCCRYENDISDMEMTPDSFGNGGVNIGSHRVVTINFPRAAMLSSGNIYRYYEILDKYFDVASKLLIVHRYDILEARIKKNPDYLRFFGSLKWFQLKTMFSTFGVVGIHEAVEFLGEDILSEDGTNIALDMMSYVKSKCKQYREEYKVTFNAEEIPGEQACVALLQKDKMYIEKNTPYELYSNQYVPLVNHVDIVTRLDLSGRFMKRISGGGIVHANFDAQIDTCGKVYDIIRLAAKSGVPHFAICYRFGKCEDHNATIVGQSKECPICGKPIVQARARVIGYFSDENNWHKVRRVHDAPHRYYSDGKEFEEQ